MVNQISDDLPLLASMLADGARTSETWRPGPYWQSYCARIERELKHSGLAGMRANQVLVKGFSGGGVPSPTLPRAAWKRLAWKTIEITPYVSRVVAEHRRLLRAAHKRAVDAEIRFARLVLERIVDAHPQMTPPEGLAFGGADDAFDWHGHMVTAEWVMHLARLADFYQVVPTSEVTATCEIGPGLGLSTLAHIALNPGLRTIVNCDIPPILYISTQYLKSIPAIDVIDYRMVADNDVLSPAAPDRPTVFQLPPWRWSSVEFEADAFFNAYSFQEMELDICRNYADIVARQTDRWVFLHSSVTGHAPGAGGQKQPVTMEFLRRTFGSAFPHEVELSGLWTQLYGHDPAEIVLLGRTART